jgi:hypothetical protein
MANYGEQLAYWYLRLNGFFPLLDFVMHRGAKMAHTSDCDVLAVRPPYVYEEVGGQLADLDGIIRANVDVNRTLGIICQVKTGKYKKAELFPQEHVIYAVGRLGLCVNPPGVFPQFSGQAAFNPSPNIRIIKLLVAQESLTDQRFLCLTVGEVREFIRMRLVKYKDVKYRDRHFFPSDMLQDFIDRVHNPQ